MTLWSFTLNPAPHMLQILAIRTLKYSVRYSVPTTTKDLLPLMEYKITRETEEGSDERRRQLYVAPQPHACKGQAHWGAERHSGNHPNRRAETREEGFVEETDKEFPNTKRAIRPRV